MNPLSQNIISDWGLMSLPPNEQADLIERVGLMLYQAVLVRSLDILSAKEEEQLDALLDKDETSTEDVLAFLERKIPTFKLLIQQEMAQLKADIFVS